MMSMILFISLFLFLILTVLYFYRFGYALLFGNENIARKSFIRFSIYSVILGLCILHTLHYLF